MNQAAAAQPHPELPIGPRMRSFMSLVGVACGVYLAADKHRRARLAGVEVTPRNPLEAVLAQSGVEFPNLEAMLVRLMGDTPEARDAASIIVNHPDPARLIREYAMRSTAPKTEEGSTSTATPAPPASPGPSASPTPPQAPPAPPQTPAAAPPAPPPPQPSVFAPTGAAFRPDYAPQPAHGAGHRPGPRAYRPDDAPHGVAFRPDYAPHPAAHWPGYAPQPAAYAPPTRPPGLPPLPGCRPPQPHHARTGGRFHPPPFVRPRPAPRPASRPVSDAAGSSWPPLPPLSQQPRPAAAPTKATHPAPPTSAAPSPDAPSSEPRTFLQWMKDKLATLERAKEAELAETRRAIAESRSELAEIQRRIDTIEAARSSEAAAAIDVKVDPPALEHAGSVDQDFSSDLEVACDAAAPTTAVSEPPVEADAPVDAASPSPFHNVAAEGPLDDATAFDEHDGVPPSTSPAAAPLIDASERDGAPTSTPPEAAPPIDPADAPSIDAAPPAEALKIEAIHLHTADDRDPNEPPLPTPVEMAEAVRLFELHERRMRDLDGTMRQELANHREEIRQVKDRCTALARIEAPQASPCSP